MYNFNIISNITMLILIGVSAFFYKHADGKYKSGKSTKIQSAPFFSLVYRWIQISSLLGIALSLADLDFLRLWNLNSLKLIGLLISSLGISLFVHSKKTLGRNYSPCFDSYIPFKVVEEGAYRFIRHPIYTANILFLLGMLLVTGNALQLFNLILLIAYNFESALKEERALLSKFSAYHRYFQRTGRFLPKLLSY